VPGFRDLQLTHNRMNKLSGFPDQQV
jgi:hypothetical protein